MCLEGTRNTSGRGLGLTIAHGVKSARVEEMSDTGTAYEGPITITKTGKGFFTYDENQEDLFIPPENLGGAFPGDIVKVERAGVSVDPRTKEKRETGKVVDIVTRTRELFVGKLIRNDEEGLTMLVPDWKKMYVPFVAKGENLPLEHKVLLRFKGWAPNQPYPWGEVVEVIGQAGVHDVEMRALALAQGFSADFPPGVVAEAKQLEASGEAELAKEAEAAIAAGRRKDFRGTTTFTIDPHDAKDFDDAISVKKLDDGNFEIGVHIADVSYFVRPGTAIDREARSRATSVYLVDRTIPMLPHVLSNNLCSLNPNLDRLAVSAVFVMDKNGEIKDRWFGETVIHSDKRFTYEEAQGVLNDGSGTLYDELVIIRDLARQIRKRRVAAGAIEFDTPEVKVKLDESGAPVDIVLKVRQDTNLLIEDFMLSANVAVAEYLTEEAKRRNLAGSTIYRVHDSPDADRIENLSQFLKVLGYHLETAPGGKVKGAAINKLIEEVKGKPEEYLIKMATLRSMGKAVYATKNVGHYGLAFEHYTHFTSPIRRYPDLLVHRMVKHFSEGDKVTQKDIEEFERLAQHSSEREVGAAEAERDSIKMKQVEYLAPRIGEEFAGVISGVTERGLYVELTQSRADGMVRVTNLGNDYFTYDEKRYRLVGTRTQKEYRLGDPVKVRLIAARIPERELDFELVQQPA